MSKILTPNTPAPDFTLHVTPDQRIQKHFGNNLRFVFRNFPIVDSHPHVGLHQ